MQNPMTYRSRIAEYKDELQSIAVEVRTLRQRYELLKEELESKTGEQYVVIDQKQSKEFAERVIHSVSKSSGVALEDMLSQSRDRKNVVARQVAAYIINDNTNITLTEVGVLLSSGKPKNHATIIHAINSVKDSYETFKKYGQSGDVYELCEVVKDFIFDK